MSELPAYRVIYADGTSYVTSMSKQTTLAKARDYFLDASLEQPDGSCKRVADVQPVEANPLDGETGMFPGSLL